MKTGQSETALIFVAGIGVQFLVSVSNGVLAGWHLNSLMPFLS
jgi:hypothetical protein